MSTWTGSATLTFKVDRRKTGAPCLLGTGPVLHKSVEPSWPVIKGKDAKLLVDAGEKKARKSGRPVVLKLMTGDRGRPATRIMLPPTPPHATAGSGSKALPKSSASGAKPRISPKRTASLPNSIDQVPSALSQLGEVRRQLERLTQTVGQLQSKVRTIQGEQADRSDVESEVRALRTMVETMRRTWRESHGYAPEHPALPTLERNSIGAQA